MILYPHQQKILDLNPPKHLLAFSTGTGKTAIAIALAIKNCKSVTVICPKALVKKWERDIAAFKGAEQSCRFYIYSKEHFRDKVKNILPTDGVIVDEAHYFAAAKSGMSKALYWYLSHHKIQFRWLLTATPYLSTPMNIFVLAHHLDYNWNYWNFQQKFFDSVQMGHRTVPKVKKNIEKQLADLVKDIGSTCDMEEAVMLAPELGEVPDQNFMTIESSLTPEQEKAISELDDDLYITRWTHRHCIENGFLYGDGYTETQVYPNEKLATIDGFIIATDKLAIFCRYSKQIELLKKFVETNHKDKKVFIIDGSSSGAERDTIVQKANKATHAVILIQSQCSAGYELPTFDTILFVSLSFSFSDYIQAQGRFLRINALSKNTFIHLVTKGVDKNVYDCIMQKQDFHITIMERRN